MHRSFASLGLMVLFMASSTLALIYQCPTGYTYKTWCESLCSCSAGYVTCGQATNVYANCQASSSGCGCADDFMALGRPASPGSPGSPPGSPGGRILPPAVGLPGGRQQLPAARQQLPAARQQLPAARQPLPGVLPQQPRQFRKKLRRRAERKQ